MDPFARINVIEKLLDDSIHNLDLLRGEIPQPPPPNFG
jgi:hypothetical protein